MTLYENTECLVNELWNGLSATEYIQQMFARTDLDGVLFIPGWHADHPGWEHDIPGSSDEYDSYRCRMDWSARDMDQLTREFETLYAQLKAIAPAYDGMNISEGEIKEDLKDPLLLQIWKKYLAPFDVGNIDMDRLQDIMERMRISSLIKMIAGDLAQGIKLSELDRELLVSYMDISVSREEMALHKRYEQTIRTDAEERIGKKLCAYEVVFHARRLCRLMNLGAPKVVIDSEARTFAAAMAVNRFGISKELVDNSLRFRQDIIEQMDEVGLDTMDRPMKTNTRKSMVPLFVYLILQEKSSTQNHMRQQDILKVLEEVYEVRIERKALSRLIHGLSDSQLPIFTDKTGVWFAQK